jgi:hypothetical protein
LKIIQNRKEEKRDKDDPPDRAHEVWVEVGFDASDGTVIRQYR